MIRISSSLLLAALLLTSCAAPGKRAAAPPRFNEAERANLIVRYYTDNTSYVLKPAATDGTFLSVLNKDAVLALAKQQPGRQLAVVALIHYGSDSQADAVKQDWTKRLTEAGYKRVVFLRASNGMRMNGLPILASRS
jgi:hypothetical protein